MKKVALVTGGSRGIGAAVAEALAQEGYAVCINYICQHEMARAMVEKLRKKGHTAICWQADVADSAAVNEMAEHVRSELGQVSLLVNNAGISQRDLFQDITQEQFHRMMDVNLFGAVNCIQAVLPDMLREHTGCIVNMSSIWGHHGASLETSYCASKHALEGLTKGLSQELAPSFIRVNAVAPGVVATDMHRVLPEETKERLNNEIPLARVCTPEEIAEAVVYLSKAEYVTGQILTVDGGFMF